MATVAATGVIVCYALYTVAPALAALSKALSKAWGDCLDGILHDLRKLKEEAREKMARINGIRTSNK